jgi:hypothetical protein
MLKSTALLAFELMNGFARSQFSRLLNLMALPNAWRGDAAPQIIIDSLVNVEGDIGIFEVSTTTADKSGAGCDNSCVPR